MNFTLFGYPRTGKTTLFNLLTGAKIEVETYQSGGRKEPNLRTCPVPDTRLDKISQLYPEKNKKNAVVDYIDLAGISFGEVKNESYMNHLKYADGLTNVVRGFQDENIPHPKGRIAPCEDIAAMEEELILTDLLSVESRLEKLDKELKRSKNPENEREKELLDRLHESLEAGKALRELDFTSNEDKLIRSFAFLSRKPLIHMINVDESDIPLISDPEKICENTKQGVAILAFCGSIEMEILELEDEEKKIFWDDYGFQEPSVTRYLKASYDLLEVITFFSVGKDEIKAWTIKAETTALDAAGVIHTDIARGFIRAEVISYEELLSIGSFQSARDAGAVRLEGRDYRVGDGDVIYFRFSK
ncbi:MAG: redox-regulated ATPase YchF [Candidatus Aminicenantes bacterium]|nr:redox-regulated ATPase YchF [Candidatus Aminicenantes bacterium]